MMSCSRATSAFGQYTGAPVAFASGATAPTWSMSVCVTRIAWTVASSCSIAPRSRSGSSPGSTTRALSDPSARRMNVFSWNGPTVKARTSTSLPLRARARLALLIAAVELQVHEVAHRDVEHQRDDAEDDRGAQRLVERDGHEGDEERDHHERSGRGAAPRRRLAEAARPRGLLLRLLALLRARRPARAAAVLDDPGGVAAVLRASLALRLGHLVFQSSALLSGREDESALVEHPRAVDLERGVGDDAVEVDRDRDRAADRDARAEGDVDRAEDLLVLEDVAGEHRALVRADPELGEVRAGVAVVLEESQQLLALGAGRPREAAALDRQLRRVAACEAYRGDRAGEHRPLSPGRRDEPLTARQVAERPGGGEVAVVGDAVAAAQVEAEVAPARARDACLGGVAEQARDGVRAAAQAVEVDRHQPREHVGRDVRHRRAAGAPPGGAPSRERV